MTIPHIETLDQLEEALSRPSSELTDQLDNIPGDFLVLGAGGKMGFSFCQMLKRALPERSIHAASRFSNTETVKELQKSHIQVHQGDLFDRDFLAGLPAIQNVLFLAGQKFGTASDSVMTWASNVALPALIAERFSSSSIVALSTGNVYPFTSPESGGATEQTVPDPVGEYAQSCLGRERMFQYYSRLRGTRVALIRLNYACELRYGILVDLVQNILIGNPIDLAMSHVNLIWQRDACEAILRCFSVVNSPPAIQNVTGQEVFSVRTLSEKIGRRLNRPVHFTGTESAASLLSNAACMKRLGPMELMGIDAMIDLACTWLEKGGTTLGKPTHFQEREGKF